MQQEILIDLSIKYNNVIHIKLNIEKIEENIVEFIQMENGVG